jgi:Asp-tRNA(Asn)/Glu-tRNA(Gln) amidotransferase A subunit family amidase
MRLLLDTPGLGTIMRGPFMAGIGLERLRSAEVGAAPIFRPDWPASPDSGPSPDVADLFGLLGFEPSSAGFQFPSVAAYAAAYRDAKLDPTSLVPLLLTARARTDEAKPPLRAFIAMDGSDLASQAQESMRRLRSGNSRGPLEGVPVAVKDELDQVPYPTTAGTCFLGKEPAKTDSTVVTRLRANGALLLGKTNMHELGIGVTGINPHHGACRNPYQPAHATGGSSSGSAAAVASGFCPVAIGVDGGGSIRIPAAFCGIVGLKPTFGRVSNEGSTPLDWNTAQVGLLGANVRDVAGVYVLVAGPDAGVPKVVAGRRTASVGGDANTLGQPAVRADLGGVAGLVLGVDRDWCASADPPVASACQAMIEKLENAGAKVQDVTFPDPDLIRLAHLVVIVCEMAAARMSDGNARYAPDTALSFILARALGSNDYLQALRIRHVLGLELRDIFDQVDLVVSPATACTAPLVRSDALTTGESDLGLLDRIMRFAPAANLFGLPAISVPAGYDAAGLPIGLQAMARPFEEHLLLRFGLAVEKEFERRKPAIWTDPPV